MGIILAVNKRNMGKVKSIGNTLNLLTLLVSISKLLAERIANEKMISIDEAEKFTIECIGDGLKTIQTQ